MAIAIFKITVYVLKRQLAIPQNKYMELGPRDKVSQAFWQEWKKGNTLKTAKGVDVVHLDLRHLGEKYLHERLPFICELASAYEGVNRVNVRFPVRLVVHYTMGGIEVDFNSKLVSRFICCRRMCIFRFTGANRLGSNSLAELVVVRSCSRLICGSMCS